MILEDYWQIHHRGIGKPSELYSEVSRDGKLIYHPEIISGWVEQSTDILMLRHEDHFIEKMVFQPRPRWWIVQTQTHEVHRMAKLRSQGELKFMSSTIIVPYLVWVEQYMALTQKETLLHQLP
jgi:quinolinate synthase